MKKKRKRNVGIRKKWREMLKMKWKRNEKNVERNNVKRNSEMKKTWKEKGNEIKVEIKKKFLQGKRNEKEEMKTNVGTRMKWNKI